jgi:hypothetical protein
MAHNAPLPKTPKTPGLGGVVKKVLFGTTSPANLPMKALVGLVETAAGEKVVKRARKFQKGLRGGSVPAAALLARAQKGGWRSEEEQRELLTGVAETLGLVLPAPMTAAQLAWVVTHFREGQPEEVLPDDDEEEEEEEEEEA